MSRQFEGFEEHLDPDNLSLISILQFRRYQDDFTYSKLHEHALISKFLTRLSEMPNWSEAALSLKKSGLLVSIYIVLNFAKLYEIGDRKEVGHFQTSHQATQQCLE